MNTAIDKENNKTVHESAADEHRLRSERISAQGVTLRSIEPRPIPMVLPAAAVPVRSVPMRLPWMRHPSAARTPVAFPEIRLPAPGVVPPPGTVNVWNYEVNVIVQTTLILGAGLALLRWSRTR